MSLFIMYLHEGIGGSTVRHQKYYLSNKIKQHRFSLYIYNLVSLSLEIVMFRHCSQSIEKFSLQSSFANQKADMDLQKRTKEKI